jgi:YD repeat-containing protein
MSEIRFLSGGGNGVFNANIVDTKYTKTGIAEMDYFDKSWDPVPSNGGFAGRSITSNAEGDFTQSVFHDVNHNPVPSPSGDPPVIRWQLDQWGNQLSESYYDAAGKPTVWAAGGFQKDAFGLDGHGDFIEEHFYDAGGQSVAQIGSGCFAYVYTRDQNGYVAAKDCFDAQGKPLNQQDTGYRRIAYQYDSAGRTIGNLYYDSSGNPVADKRTIGAQQPKGCFGWLWGYDQNFDRKNSYSVCLDANGHAYDPSQIHDIAHVAHEYAFDFSRAFELDQQLVAQDSTPAYRMDLEEAALTDNQFDVCLAQAAAIKDSDVSSPETLVRDAVLLACQYASGKKTAARATAASLAGRVNQLSMAGWTFAGTRYYVQTSNYFRTGTDAWDKFFLSLQKGDGQGAAAALSQLQPVLQG